MTEETVTTDQLDRARELIAETERVRQWLDRLDDGDSDRPPHIVERVRSDYVARLEDLTGKLRSHRTTVEDSLDEARRALEERESVLSDLRDRFEELRLRHEIGEIEDDQWAVQRPEVETEATRAEHERDSERERVAGLEALLAELGSGTAEQDADEDSDTEGEIEGSGETASGEDASDSERKGSPVQAAEVEPSEAEAAEASVEAAFEQWDDEPGGASESPAEGEDDPSEVTAEDDLAFLEDLDRAITTPDAGQSVPKPAPAAASEASDTAAQRLPCKECGAVNDPRAWYCEVCGMELS